MKRTVLNRSSSAVTLMAAAAAAAISVALFAGMVDLFERDGFPFENVVAAERACSTARYVSDREMCMRQWLAAQRAERIAQK